MNLTAYCQYLLNDSTVCLSRKNYTTIVAKGVEYKMRFENSQQAIDSLFLAYSICELQIDALDTALTVCKSKSEIYEDIINVHEDKTTELENQIKKKDKLIKIGGGSALVLIIILAIL
jgi:hypothetical protein